MNDHQISLVQTTFAQVEPIADVASALFYDDLFERAPELRPLFPDDMTAQRAKLMTMLGAAVAGLTDWENVAPVVRDLGARHVAYGVRAEHFDAVGAALLATLEKGLGPAFTPEVHDAWAACFGLVAAEMLGGMDDSAADPLSA